jgi:hypothetical protein
MSASVCFREHTPLACGFRRRAENLVPQTFFRGNFSGGWFDESPGATPGLASGARALPVPASEFGLNLTRPLFCRIIPHRPPQSFIETCGAMSDS